MSRAITARGWTGRALGLEGLPGEGSAIKETFLLPTCCKWTAIGTAVGGILPTDVAQTVTARNWTPGDRQEASWQMEVSRGNHKAVSCFVLLCSSVSVYSGGPVTYMPVYLHILLTLTKKNVFFDPLKLFQSLHWLKCLIFFFWHVTDLLYVHFGHKVLLL